LPLWPYSASENVNRARNSQPGKTSINLNMQFIDYAWRHATVPAGEIALRLWQNVAHGGAAAFAVNGTLRQPDMQAIDVARPIYEWLARHERYYVDQQSAARVLLLNRGAGLQAYRGMYRLLAEQHIPFAISTNLDWIGKREYDLVISVDGAPAELKGYPGRVLIVGARPPGFDVARVVRTWKDQRAYMRVRSTKLFPSLQRTSLLMLHGDYTEVEGDGSQSLSFVPESMFGPPEKIHVDQVDTAKPGIVSAYAGRVVWIPWDASALYYRHSMPAHADLLQDTIDRLMPQRQLRTNAHPLVEITVMKQGRRMLVHLINMIGHSQTAYHAPVSVRDLRIELPGVEYTAARTLRIPAALGQELVIKELRDYELLVLE
jgi:hypothetical protein